MVLTSEIIAFKFIVSVYVRLWPFCTSLVTFNFQAVLSYNTAIDLSNQYTCQTLMAMLSNRTTYTYFDTNHCDTVDSCQNW